MTYTMNLANLFDNDQLLLDSAFNPLQITLSLLITLLLVVFIFYIYKKTYTGVLYSKNFNLTLVITALVVNAIMIGISGNIVLSLGLVGALSIIRFRTAVKDPKDTAFIFWAITVGVINGVAYYELSIISSAFIAAVLLYLSKKSMSVNRYLLILKYKGDIFAKIDDVLQKFFKTYTIRNSTSSDQEIEKVIEVQIKNQNIDRLTKRIQNITGMRSCVLLSSNGDFSE